jgi:hypothetical protein
VAATGVDAVVAAVAVVAVAVVAEVAAEFAEPHRTVPEDEEISSAGGSGVRHGACGNANEGPACPSHVTRPGP